LSETAIIVALVMVLIIFWVFTRMVRFAVRMFILLVIVGVIVIAAYTLFLR
jgi:hypothetical protein